MDPGGANQTNWNVIVYQVLSSQAIKCLARWTIRVTFAIALLASASAISSLSFVSVGYAQCAPDGIAGVEIICSGTDVDGFQVPAGGVGDFIVNMGATVTDVAGAPPVDGVIEGLADGVTSFLNLGTIEATRNNREGVVLLEITAGGFINTGTITGHGTGDGVVIGSLSDGAFRNSGTITGDGGVAIIDSTVSFSNSGTITGTVSDAVYIDDDLENFLNTGALISQEDGLYVFDRLGSAINYGEIHGYDDGVEAFNIGTFVNYGLISSTDGDGIDVDGGNPNDETNVITSLINHGTIRAGDDGIDVGTLTRLLNTGIIYGGFTGDIETSGIAAAVITEIINSGTIRTGGDINIEHAIEERIAGDTSLTLNAGSILIGLIDLGGGVNTLNIGAGRSLNSRFDSNDGAATLPVLGTLAGNLVAFDGSATQRQIVAVDLSAFVSFDDALAALTSGFGGAVQSRQAAVRSDPSFGFASRFAAADETSLAAFSDLDRTGSQHLNPNRFWIEGFGAYRQDQSNRTGSDFDSLIGGLVAGVDVPLDAMTSVGVMAGFSASTSENEINTQSTDATSYFGGIYASTQAGGIFWDASLTVGYTDYDAERITANNLVANGLETASADFGGWFINPQVTLTREAANPLAGSNLGSLMATSTLEQSLTLAYAGLFLDGYTETGTTNPLTLDDRSVHVASARASLALPFEAIHANDARTTLRLIGGLEARIQFGDDTISGTLLGQAVSTTLDEDAFTGGAFLGLAGEYETTSGLTAYANVEAMLETDMAYQISATAGLRIAF